MAKISLRAYNREIESLIDEGQIDQAIEHCRYILQAYPKHIATYNLLGKGYLESKRHGDAGDIFLRVLSSLPDDFVSHVGMSIIREDEGNLDGALWHMERAFEVQPSNSAIQDELRRLYGRRDGLEPPKIRLTRGALARMYAKGALYQQAIAELRAALVEDPDRADLQVLLARMYFLNRQRTEAVEACSSLLQKLPYCLEANRILALILPETELSLDTEIYKQRLIALDPYLEHAGPELTSAESVPDETIAIEKLGGDAAQASILSGAQPEWPASPGVAAIDLGEEQDKLPEWLNIGEEQTSQEPVTGDDLIPGWMKEAGWSPSSGEVESEGPPAFDYSTDEEFTSGVNTEELAKAEIPEWLQAIAPAEPAIEGQDTSLAGDSTEGEALTSLDGDDHPQTAEIDWSDEELFTAAEEGTPDWLSDLGAAEGASGEGLPIAAEGDVLPDWLKELGEPSSLSGEEGESASLEAAPLDMGIESLLETKPEGEISQVLRIEDEGETPTSWLESLAAEDRDEAEPEAGLETGEYELPTMEEPAETAAISIEPKASTDEIQTGSIIEPAPDEPKEGTPMEERMQGMSEGAQGGKSLIVEGEPAGIETEVEPSSAEDKATEAMHFEAETGETESIEAAGELLETLEPVEEVSTGELDNQDELEQLEQIDWIEEVDLEETALIEPSPGPDLVQETDELMTEPANLLEDTQPVRASKSTEEEGAQQVAGKDTEKPVAADFLTPSETPAWFEEFIVPSLEEETQEKVLEASVPSIDEGGEPALPWEEPPSWLVDTVPVETQGEAATAEDEQAALTMDSLEESAVSPDQTQIEEIPTWLKDDAATVFEEQAEEIPSWLKEIGEESDATTIDETQDVTLPEGRGIQPDSVAEMEMAGPSEDDWLPEPLSEGTRPDESLAWLEMLAAKQGAAEEDLLTLPEDRRDSPPEWVQQLIQEETTQAESEEIHPSDQASEVQADPSWLLEITEAEQAEKEMPAWLGQAASQEVDEVEKPDLEPTILEEVVHLPAEGVVDINSASFSEIERVPGIGFVLAERIVSHRESSGPFQNLEELSAIEGVDEALMAEISGKLMVVPVEEIAGESLAEGVDSSSGDPDQDLLDRARQALSQGNLDGTISGYSQLIRRQILLDQVLADLQEAVYRFPVEVSVWEILGDAYMRKDQLQEAMEAYNKAEELLR